MEGLTKGLYEELFESLRAKSMSNGFELHPKDIAEATKLLREEEMDSHIGVMGQNGLGKSMATFILQKYCGGINLDSMLFPFTPVSKLIYLLSEKQNENIYIDELQIYFDYLGWNSLEQRALMQTIETNRANQNVMFGCCRDVTRINHNYRNGKIHTLIWLLDRITGKKPYSYGVVLLGILSPCLVLIE